MVWSPLPLSGPITKKNNFFVASLRTEDSKSQFFEYLERSADSEVVEVMEGGVDIAACMTALTSRQK